MKRRIRGLGKELIRRQFVFLQRFGFDLLPRHFYSEIPDTRRLRTTSTWRKAYSMVGVDGADCDEQLAFVRTTVRPDLPQRHDIYHTACEDNGEAGYGPIEGEFLTHYIITYRPRLVIQVGAGVSTSIIRRAAKIAGYEASITCVDPFPTDYLRRLALDGAITLLDRAAEDLSFDVVGQMRAGDLLFIDSTHTLGPAGEVTRLVLEWLPRLAPGARVHFHDIMFPYDYPQDILTSALFFPHETALLHAFLCMNESFRIQCSLSMLHHARQRELMALFPSYRPSTTEDGVLVRPGHYPTSIFLERTR